MLSTCSLLLLFFYPKVTTLGTAPPPTFCSFCAHYFCCGLRAVDYCPHYFQARARRVSYCVHYFSSANCAMGATRKHPSPRPRRSRRAPETLRALALCCAPAVVCAARAVPKRRIAAGVWPSLRAPGLTKVLQAPRPLQARGVARRCPKARRPLPPSCASSQPSALRGRRPWSRVASAPPL